MRYMLVDSKHRKVWEMQSFGSISEDLLRKHLVCDYPARVALTDDVDLWVPEEPKPYSFRFFADGPEYSGNGVICGRAKHGGIAALPRFYGFEMVAGWIAFPRVAAPPTRRPPPIRPGLMPAPGLVPSLEGERPYVMAMYG